MNLADGESIYVLADDEADLKKQVEALTARGCWADGPIFQFGNGFAQKLKRFHEPGPQTEPAKQPE
jgi:hypothetical protein